MPAQYIQREPRYPGRLKSRESLRDSEESGTARGDCTRSLMDREGYNNQFCIQKNNHPSTHEVPMVPQIYPVFPTGLTGVNRAKNKRKFWLCLAPGHYKGASTKPMRLYRATIGTLPTKCSCFTTNPCISLCDELIFFAIYF